MPTICRQYMKFLTISDSDSLLLVIFSNTQLLCLKFRKLMEEVWNKSDFKYDVKNVIEIYITYEAFHILCFSPSKSFYHL